MAKKRSVKIFSAYLANVLTLEKVKNFSAYLANMLMSEKPQCENIVYSIVK